MTKNESGQAALEYLLMLAALLALVAFLAYMVKQMVWNPTSPNRTIAGGIIDRVEHYRETVIGRD
ncbi:MAG: hypothetical protein HY929_04805 [Euryarchaeota archaeon]|nr:hypothetical protein [Euryarchaeota archaeon]